MIPIKRSLTMQQAQDEAAVDNSHNEDDNKQQQQNYDLEKLQQLMEKLQKSQIKIQLSLQQLHNQQSEQFNNEN